jgi:5-methylcytosine-specific restriction endonuclease McrA
VARGRGGRRWARLSANLKMQRRHCCRCHQPIDYTLRYPDPMSFSVDHFPFPLSTHPHLAEDPSNLDAAHLVCNQAAGNHAVKPTIGTVSRAW